MTAKRETELETENRMLREQVASLEKIIEQMSRPGHVTQWTTTPAAGGYPWYYTGTQWYANVPAVSNGTMTFPSSTITMNDSPTDPG